MAIKGIDDEVYCFQNEILSIVINNENFIQKRFNNRLIWIDQDKDGNLWLGTDKNGIIKIGSDINNVKHQTYLKGLSVSSSFFDIEGGKWFSTLENGVYYIPSEGFISYSLEDGIKNKKISSLAILKDLLFLGLNNKFLSIIDTKSGFIKSNLGIPGDSTGDIKALKATSNNLLWIGTDEYLYSYDGSKLNKYINNHNKIPYSSAFSRNVFSIKDIEEYDNNALLLAEARGLTLIRNGNVIYNSFLDDEIELRIESIEKESDSCFLLGTISGLWRMTGLRFEFLGLQNPLFKHRANTVVSLGPKKGFIVGTKGSGLIISMGDSIWQITKSHGLASNSISSLLLTNNDLWIGTNHGLNLIDISKLKQKYPPILLYNKAHGLISNEINALEGSEEYIYIATNMGLTILDKKKLRLPNFHPPVYLNNVKIMKRDTTILDSYQLHHNQNFITISYIGISFRDGGNLRYKYRLKGLSNEWISTNNLEVEYAFLPPGDYQFEVVAINSEGNASINPAVLSFRISPPFWKTWWFISLVFLLIVLSGVSFYYSRLKTLKKEHELQNNINWYRQQALTRQMDPHFVFNTLNSIQSYIIKNDRLSSSQYLSKFARLMRLILNNSQKQAIPLSDEIAALNLYMELESLRFQQKFEFAIITDHSVDVDTCYIPAFLIQPFVENAIWHGIMGLKNQGIIRISFTREKGQLICHIEDNGIGRAQSMEMKSENEKQKKSLGISLVETRLNLLNYFYSVNMKVIFTDLYNEDNSPAGTKVTINLPIIN
jgi:ligand-binding sensor domain-containing protein